MRSPPRRAAAVRALALAARLDVAACRWLTRTFERLTPGSQLSVRGVHRRSPDVPGVARDGEAHGVFPLCRFVDAWPVVERGAHRLAELGVSEFAAPEV